MDWKMEEVCDDVLFGVEEDEIDMDYEFDAPKFYDFTRFETDSEAGKAELWFDISGGYPPTPFVGNWCWKQNADVDVADCQPCSTPKAGENSDPNRTYSNAPTNVQGLKSSNAESKFTIKTSPRKNLHYMNPTASQLAKQHQSPEIHCNCLLKRIQKLSFKGGKESSPKSSPTEIQATKRQKFEVGYLRKVASINHQTPLLHKAPKKGGLLSNNHTISRLKVTIPREPNLVTAYRAEKHRSKINSEFVDHKKSNEFMFRARPLNRKILKAPLLPIPRRSGLQMPEFQVFHLRTSERAFQHKFADVRDQHVDNSFDMANACSVAQNELTSLRRLTSGAALRTFVACNTSDTRCFTKKDNNFRIEKTFIDNPFLESLGKLSLACDYPCNAKCKMKMPLHWAQKRTDLSTKNKR